MNLLCKGRLSLIIFLPMNLARGHTFKWWLMFLFRLIVVLVISSSSLAAAHGAHGLIGDHRHDIEGAEHGDEHPSHSQCCPSCGLCAMEDALLSPWSPHRLMPSDLSLVFEYLCLHMVGYPSSQWRPPCFSSF